jgi:glutamate-1-semialdehyde 2,1-aminomutase
MRYIVDTWTACLAFDGSCRADWTNIALLAAVGGALVALALVGRRFAVNLLTLRARAWAPPASRWLARWVRHLHYSEDRMLRADGAGPATVARRRRGLEHLTAGLRLRFSRSVAWGDALRDSFSDLRFTDANRVPFQFARVVRERLNVCSVVTESRGPRLKDLDGQWTLDVSGAYGVNVAGFDCYKTWMRRGLDRVQEVGPVLGPLHPLVADNVKMLKRVSGLDEVSFHMSGTEAVMAAVRLARHNTRRRLIVCFAGAYHGWWDGVQPGLGNERDLPDCLTLKDMHPASLAVIRRRAHEIAAVLVNPVQCFHPNSPPPSDAVLMTSDVRKVSQAQAQYAEWLADLRNVCTRYDVPLVFDEVYSGFRLAPAGAQEFFGVRADMVVYGKTVAGGMPIGVVCGRHELMRRLDPERPMRVAYVVGTFSAHPVVMGAMHEFLLWLTQPETVARYRDVNERCATWVWETNTRLRAAGLPMRLAHLGSVWTVLFDGAGRFNWLLQYYLRAEGVTLSWVGTGRCLSSMDFTAEDYAALQEALIAAGTRMQTDGWWPAEADEPERVWTIRLGLAREILESLVQLPQPVRAFHAEVMKRKEDDHDASHHDLVNQALHLLSSSAFVFAYVMLFADLTLAMWVGLPALFLRQIGHAVFEPPAHERERALLGFTTRSKTLIVLGYLSIPLLHLAHGYSVGVAGFADLAPGIARHWFVYTLLIVPGRTAYLVWKRGRRNGMIWLVKLLTDPLTDLVMYSPARLRRRLRPA